ncbi:MAG: NAD(P)/FAD-dependent oxidoreductase, partial [Clostridia bacterium]|nr:NAD(P)/FAD-dependent oxidoreductase [Clostridia bacterium]
TLEKHDISLSAVAPSKCERAYFANTKVRALSHKEVKKLIQQFIDGAVRCKKAGVDGVQLHASHGYLIQQFLSPYTNQRTDEYGGSLENRFRFLKEIIEGVKKECGDDYPVIVRITADEFYEKEGKCGKAGDGYTLKDCLEYAKMIEAAGVNAIDVSSAGYDRFNYWLEPTSFELGWRKYLAAEVKKVVSIPVIAANLIRTPEQAEQQLEEGVQDFISMGRPHIADPYFAKKAQEGRSEDIKRCICCLYCIESMEVNAYHGTCAHCSVNPAMGREREYNSMTKDGNGRTVVVVGAGMAGLVSAEILAKRGFKPVVLEKADKVGGQILLAAAPPHKEKIGWCVQDAANAAVKAGAEIRLNTLATPELIDSLNPYAIIVATGAVAVKPRSIKGSNGANVFTTTELLDGSVKLENKKLVIVGSGMTGLETAEMLVGQGNKLTIVEMLDEVAKGVWFQHKDDALPKLNAAGTEFILSHKLCSIDEKGITICPVK